MGNQRPKKKQGNKKNGKKHHVYAVIVLLLAAAIIIYTMIKNILISAVIGVIGEVALIIIYVVKSSIFEGGIQKVLDVFNLSGHFDNFTSNIFDIKGIVYFLSVIAVCLFLTTQSILKRRWN